MASETYFGVGERVKLNYDAISGDVTQHDVDGLLALEGVVIDVDDSPRECCYYMVEWDDLSDHLWERCNDFCDLDLDQYLQSDYLRKVS